MRLLQKDEYRKFDDFRKYSGVIIYGVGFYFDDIFGFLCDQGMTIHAICDSNINKQGRVIQGLTINSPKDTFVNNYERNKIAVVVGASSNQIIIYKYLTEELQVDGNDIFSLITQFTIKYMYDSNAIIREINKVKSVYDILDDEESKITYENLLNNKLSISPKYLKNNNKMKYSYEYCINSSNVLPHIDENGVIVDCGAYIGDTAYYFLNRYPKLSEIICIEPLSNNYKRMVSMSKDQKMGRNITPIHAALGDKTGVVNIGADSDVSVSASTAFSAESKIINEIVKMETLDSLLMNKDRVDFIKFDIEGAEIDALNGGIEALRKFKPQMMISAYHRTSHLWEIPLWIKKNFPASKIYLGHQLNAPFEPEYYVTL